MKKILFLGAMAAMLLGTASCSNEVDQPAMGDEVNAAFSVSMDGIESRTISDGLTVNELYFEVYEAKTADGTTTYTKLQSLSQKVAVSSKTATVTTKLIKGKTYKFAFWAQKEGAYNAADLQNIAMNYTNANDENRDAFFANVEKTVTATFEQNVTLYRPFAQINFGASDVDALMDISGFTSQLVVKNVPNQFNVLSGEASGDQAEVTLAATAVPARIPETLKVDGKDYTYISMNYILATPEKATKDITLKVMDGETVVKELPVSACPMQRNYRTNILGDILSVEGKFNITIDPIYAGEYNLPEKENVVTMNGKEFTTIEAAYNAALEDGLTDIVMSLAKGTYTIDNNFAFENKDKVTNVTVQAAQGVQASDIIINGRFAMSASSEQKVATGSSMTIKGLTLTTTTTDNTKNDATHYYRSGSEKSSIYIFGGVKLTVEDCIFNISDAAQGKATGVVTWGDQATTAVIKNCVFNCEGNSKPLQIGNGNSNTIENCTFNQPKKYAVQVNHYKSTDPASQLIFKNNTINANPNAKNYGIALDSRQESYYNLTITIDDKNVMNDAINGSYLYAHADTDAWGFVTVIPDNKAEWGIYPQ